MKSDNETVTGYLNLSKITKVKYHKINKELTFIYSYLKYMLLKEKCIRFTLTVQ